MNNTFCCDGQVKVYENFLSEIEINVLYNFVKNFNYDELKDHESSYWGKRLINANDLKTNTTEKTSEIIKLLDTILLRVIDVLNKYYKLEKWKINNLNLIKMYNGSAPSELYKNGLEMFIHKDNQAHMESPIFWGSVIYINDNYDGGEIFYPEYNHSYKPKAGSLVIHSGEIKHGVKKVFSGNRYCISGLVSIDGIYNENPLPTKTNNPNSPYYYPAGYYGKRMPDDPIQEDVKNPRSDGSYAQYNSNPVI